MANYPSMRFWPGPDLLLKDLIEKEDKLNVHHALEMCERAKIDAFQIKKRALLRRAGLKVMTSCFFCSGKNWQK